VTGTLCLISCDNFKREISASLAAEGWDDVVNGAFLSRCGRPALVWDEVRMLLPEGCQHVVVLGSACLKGLGEPPAGLPPARVVPLEHCFHLVAGRHLVDEIIGSGGYLITPGWLTDWRKKLREMGFAPEQAAEFFRENTRELLLLDTAIDPQSASQLTELGDSLGLPARCIPVGLDYTQLLLARLVLEWRLESGRRDAREAARRHAGELADHVSAMDMLTRLAKTLHESEAIATIEDLFRMLFAPTELHYLRVEHGQHLPLHPLPGVMKSAMRGLSDDYDWTPDGRGFLLRIGHGEEFLGVVAVDRLAFPEYRERYLNMALAVTGVCGLAIQNARNRKKLLEAEKMASLGILVAGVAHEINTPLGVVLAAASALREKSSQLARLFSQRSMTQADLERYLETSATSTSLICHNMERIGYLTEAFRQVAVTGTGTAPEKRCFRLRGCLEDVIRSLGDRLPADRIAVTIQCDPQLEIESLANDWVTIFLNLISNSLKHGFKEREQGAIDIDITCDQNMLTVGYHDDGAGLEPEVLARIFDPFFTTDLQNGMGLGMHLVYNLITHRLAGSINCESVPAQGVRFHIEVPL
jgi:signal transduction histidine kinase